MTLEGEEEPEQADTDTQRKRPDAWAVSCDERRLLILEFTRPNDRCEEYLFMTRTRSRRPALSGVGGGHTDVHCLHPGLG
jgi:hypothetical protein